MRVLVVEDFAPLRKAIAQGLREAGYAVDEAGDGETGLWQAQSESHDVIVLDLMLPKRDGRDVLRTLRQRNCPASILILSAKDLPEDRVSGLDLGADDYLVKPFHFPELVARVKALVRRKYAAKSTVLSVGDLEVDLQRRIVRRAGGRIGLTGREYALLEFLAMNSERAVSRTEIREHVYDFNASLESNVIDVTVARLRAKIERKGSPALIHTRRGQGYLLAASDTSTVDM